MYVGLDVKYPVWSDFY